MVSTIDLQQRVGNGPRDTRLLACAAVLAFPASVAVLLLASPGTASPLVYWAVSSVALLTALVVIAVGGCAWESTVASARAAGLVGR